MTRIKGHELATPVLDRGNIHGGLTIRAEFAKAAMQGLCGNQDITARLAAIGVKSDEMTSRLAEHAVAQADALLAALNAGAE